MSNNLPNIIMIVMDTVGAKHMSLYGYHRRTTPNLEEIAKESTFYSRCYAPGNWTLSSHASLFTGLYPSEHLVDGSALTPHTLTLGKKLQH
ncbi:MAG: sulfatase-like hydrolase/transferase, partial [Deltaproteobacteria bacterium]|nr:sulfatase-like hydrolase/transferase [Deltaproteobacteria bacterium]